MPLDDATIAVLTSPLEKSLYPICEAEPALLASYVLALLRKDMPRAALQEVCTERLVDFLGDETPAFVARLFDCLREYDREGQMTPAALDLLHVDAKRSNFKPKDSPTMAQKRRALDSSEDDMRRSTNGHQFDEPHPKRKKGEEEEENGYDSDEDRKHRRERIPTTEDQQSQPADRDYRRFDRDQQDRGFRSNRGNGRGGRFHNTGPLNTNPIRRRQRCRDYDEKGICTRGDMCIFDHGNDRITLSDVSELQRTFGDNPNNMSAPTNTFAVPQSETDFAQHQSKRPRYDQPMDTYDPEAPSVSGSERQGQFPDTTDFRQPRFRGPKPPVGVPDDSTLIRTQPLPFVSGIGPFSTRPSNRVVQAPYGVPNTFDESQGQSSSSDGRQPPPYPRRRRGPYDNNMQPNANQDQKSLMICGIPQELNTMDQLNSHFKKFGTVVSIQVKFNANKAFVQFSNHMDAMRAIHSPEAVLGNRFIKVFFAQRQDDHQPPEKPEPRISHNIPTYVKPEQREPFVPSPVPVVFAPAKPSIAEKKDQLLALQKKKDELRMQQIMQQKQLLEKLEQKLKDGTVDQKERGEIMATMKAGTEAIALLLKKDSSALAQKKAPTPVVDPKTLRQMQQKEMLDRELDMMNQSPGSLATPSTTSSSDAAPGLSHLEMVKKKLEDKARSLGIDPALANPSGRGRGSTRGRGRGRGGARGGKGSALVLDNRTSSIALLSRPPGLVSETAMRDFFGTCGEIADISIGSEKAVIQFVTRRSAEQAIFQCKSFDNQPVLMQWHTPASKPVEGEPTAMDSEEKEEPTEPSSEAYSHYDEEEEDSERSWKR